MVRDISVFCMKGTWHICQKEIYINICEMCCNEPNLFWQLQTQKAVSTTLAEMLVLSKNLNLRKLAKC